jgi:hypothetical protein
MSEEIADMVDPSQDAQTPFTANTGGAWSVESTHACVLAAYLAAWRKWNTRMVAKGEEARVPGIAVLEPITYAAGLTLRARTPVA